MKKLIIILFIILILTIGGFLVWNFLRIKPLLVSDVDDASSSNLKGNVGISFEKKNELNVLGGYSLGELSIFYKTNSGYAWKDNNNFIDGKKYPLGISVSNQEGAVPEQTLNIAYDGEKSIQVYVPALSGEGGPWAYFFVDKEGSTYWACASKQPCDTETLSSKNSLKKENLARKAG